MTPFRAYLDPLYGDVRIEDDAMVDLVRRPITQRLRHIRLSNIDSLSLPGIAGITRYEHALGTMYLASRTQVAQALGESDRLLLLAAALLHDSAIPPFGHLVEEALAVAGHPYAHEEKWAALIGRKASDLGGAFAMQLLVGRHPELREWCGRAFGQQADSRLEQLVDTILGHGDWGSMISGPLDLDNLDNVVRMAYHMGIVRGPEIPLTVAQSMATASGSRVLFHPASVPAIGAWCDLRTEVYRRLMPSPEDFVGKVMLLYASAKAIEEGQYLSDHWYLTDFEFISGLQAANDRFVSDTTRRWIAGDLWDLLGTWWMHGPVPELPSLLQLSKSLSGRDDIYLYRIKDKRHRAVSIRTTAGETVTTGKKSSLWLVGLATPSRRRWSAAERDRLLRAMEDLTQSKVWREESSTPSGGLFGGAGA